MPSESDWIALDPQAHRAGGYGPPADMTFASRQVTAPLVLAELPAAPFYSLALEAWGEPYRLVAVLVLELGRNLFVTPGQQWVQGAYVPSIFRGILLCCGPGRW